MDDITALALPDLDGRDGLITIEVRPAAQRVLEVWTAEQQIAAIHESSHALVASLCSIPMNSVSIEGFANRPGGHLELGVGADTELSFETGARLLDRICCALAGWAGETVILGAATTGCEADIATATALAERRITAGLDPNPDAPFIAISSLSWCSVPEVLKTRVVRSILPVLLEQRERARLLVVEHQSQVLTFAGSLFSARRLDRDALDQALMSAGLPVRARA
jgi:ATP-dependent Zn protease